MTRPFLLIVAVTVALLASCAAKKPAPLVIGVQSCLTVRGVTDCRTLDKPAEPLPANWHSEWSCFQWRFAFQETDWKSAPEKAAIESHQPECDALKAQSDEAYSQWHIASNLALQFTGAGKEEQYRFAYQDEESAYARYQRLDRQYHGVITYRCEPSTGALIGKACYLYVRSDLGPAFGSVPPISGGKCDSLITDPTMMLCQWPATKEN